MYFEFSFKIVGFFIFTVSVSILTVSTIVNRLFHFIESFFWITTPIRFIAWASTSREVFLLALDISAFFQNFWRFIVTNKVAFISIWARFIYFVVGSTFRFNFEVTEVFSCSLLSSTAFLLFWRLFLSSLSSSAFSLKI